MIMIHAISEVHRHGKYGFSRATALSIFSLFTALAVPAARADVIFTRNTQTGEGWAHYTATFTPTYSGNYTLGFNLTAGGGPSGDNSILIDAVTVTSGATVLFADGFETPDLANNTGISAGSGSASIGNWVCTNSSGILDGSPPNWGLSGQGLGFADGTRQYGFLQKYNANLPNIKAASTLALIAGQTYTVSFYQASRRDFGGTTTYTVTLDAPPPVTVFASGISPVIAWDPIFPAALVVPDSAESKPVPTVGYDDPRWTNPHPASVFPTNSHPWEYQSWVPAAFKFDANWINAWGTLASNGMGGPGQSWTKYSTMITGEGDFVLQFMADNASWIYIDGELVGFQDYHWPTNGSGRYTISLSGAEPHELSFIIWDGGGLAGGKFRIETVQSFQENNPGEELPPPPPPSDSTPPVITAPRDILAEATSADGAVVTFAVSAEDDVDGRVAVVVSPESGSTFPLGATTVDVGAGDAAGNIAHATFTVTVVDTTAPELAVPSNVTAEATSPSGAVVSYPEATATDAVGVIAITYSDASGSTFPIGPTTVTVTASDRAGNASSGSFTIQVVDTTAPALTIPASQTLEATGPGGAAATFSASATDAVGVTSLTYSHASGGTFPIGTTSVTVTATDAAGNASSGSFTIQVVDTTAPVLASVSPSTGTLWSPNHKMVPITITAVASDIVGVSSLKIISVTSSEPDNGLGDGDTANDIEITGDLTVNLRAERGGGGNGRVYTITVEAKDAAGNASTATTTVSVPKSQGPAQSAPKGKK